MLVAAADTKDHLIEHLVDQFVERKRTVNTRRAYMSDINGLLDYLNVKTINDLALISFPDVVERIYLFLEETKNIEMNTQELKNPKTVNRKAYAISSFFQFLMNVYGYPKNPLYDYQPYTVHRHSNTQSLTRPELIDLLAHAKSRYLKNQTGFRNYLAICFMLILALRRSSVVAIKKSDINHDDISVRTVSKGGVVAFKPLPAALYALINEYVAKYPTEIDYLFHPVVNYSTKILNKPINTNYLYRMVKTMMAYINPVKNITPHSLRKTFIEQALDNNEDFISIINSTDHATVEMIKYYDGRTKLNNNSIHNMGKFIK